jgi:hypothetical protein
VHWGVDLRENSACVDEERLARRQQAHAAPGSFEEWSAGLVLEREDVTAERRLCQVQPPRGSTHVAFLGHGLDSTALQGVGTREAT